MDKRQLPKPLYEHESYMKGVAAQLKSLNAKGHVFVVSGFHRMAVAILQPEMRFPAMIIDYDRATNLVDPGGDNPMRVNQYAVYLVDSVREDEPQSLREAARKTRELADQIVARMLCDYHRHDAPHGMKYLDVDSIVIDPLPAPIGHVYGVVLLFAFQEPARLALRPELWQIAPSQP